jgi:predicted RNA-binding protein with TRAM domain
MAGLSFDVLRVGKKYRLVNYGDVYEFEIERILTNGDFKVKDIHTLERYLLKDTIKFGEGRDFEIRELIS